jgi:hypothetical protein
MAPIAMELRACTQQGFPIGVVPKVTVVRARATHHLLAAPDSTGNPHVRSTHRTIAPRGASKLNGANANDTRSMMLPTAMHTKPISHSGCVHTFTGAGDGGGVDTDESLPSDSSGLIVDVSAAACFCIMAIRSWQSFCRLTPKLDNTLPRNASVTPTSHVGKVICS